MPSPFSAASWKSFSISAGLTPHFASFFSIHRLSELVKFNGPLYATHSPCLVRYRCQVSVIFQFTVLLGWLGRVLKSSPGKRRCPGKRRYRRVPISIISRAFLRSESAFGPSGPASDGFRSNIHLGH